VLKRIIQVFSILLIQAVILFISAGTLDWMWAWVLIGSGLVLFGINALVLPPELIAERGRIKKGVKPWDKLINTLNLFPSIGLLVIAGLDERFGWSILLADPIHIIALLMLFSGEGLFIWAMSSNRFFSTLVRIQKERDHTVTSSGPYQYIRHPGYTGYIVFTLATPLILGSLWALIPAGVTAGLFILRTFLEDKTLQKELKGYRNYIKKVKYRLIPGLW